MKAAFPCRFFLPVSLVTAVAWSAYASATETTFKLKEVSAFSQRESQLTRGQMAPCQDAPCTEVKTYPALKSKKPIYGSSRFASQRNKPNSGLLFYFVIDESKGTGQGYDQLFLDRNQDLDLRNDTPLKPDRSAPEPARMSWSNIREQVLFEAVDIAFDCGTAGERTVQVLPRLIISKFEKDEYKQMSFIRTRAYEGDIKIADKQFRALLGNDYAIDGRLDTPGTMLLLSENQEGRREEFRWWGGDRLSAIHKIDGKFYRFAATIIGDELTVRPYDGDLGKLEIGPGARKLDTMTIQGSFDANDFAVPVGGDFKNGSLTEARSCLLPVGDYSPNYVSLNYGKLRLSISHNYHSDGKPRQREDRERVFGIQIRKDKPYVWDFSNKPEVMFASPARDTTIKRGETLQVSAVLTDPKLDFMIRGLDDTTRTQTKDADGNPLGYERKLSLDPRVLITRLSGEKVAEGVMPFG